MSSPHYPVSDPHRLEAIVRSINECIKGVDINCRLTDMNPAGLQLIGAESFEQVKGQSVLELIDPAYHEQFKDGVRRVFDGETVDQEFEIIGLNGKRRWMHQVAVPLFHQDGQTVTEMIAVTRDITNKKEQADTIARMRRNELIGNLSAGIAHDFNNILTIISGNQEVLAQLNSQPELRPAIEKIAASVQRASSLTSKLLKRPGDSSPKTEMVTTRELFSEMQLLLQEVIPSNIALRWQVDETLEELLDKYELEDAVLNLVLNARNAIEHHGNIDIRIQLRDASAMHERFFVNTPLLSERYLAIEVEDTGCGIAQDRFEDIFLPFKSYVGKGSGLGLAMVYGFAVRNEYGLSLCSRPGKGSCFSIWIPDRHFIKRPTKLNNHLTFEAIEEPLTVVLIDDERDLLDITQKLLVSLGHTVLSFGQPAKAQSFIEQNLTNIDIVVTDEVMPGNIQGHDIAKQFSHDLPVVITSGYAEPIHVSGMGNISLQKPFKSEQLIDKMAEVMAQFTTLNGS
ncbi:hybrid sensor histidine kinase/response regulator [Alteromonas facilis]|uniref:hybrid sensor histidine kinase/response regulator n=1 Tax=Alteromonas facilis TaxID=2048004 RepID=UPI000C284413|nr:PAS domain-containing sensor histidine kinase [Alteromonas facilis]